MVEKPEKLSDAEIVRLVLKDQDKFLYLMQRYQEKLLRYIRRISKFGLEESEDLLQEVFIKVYQNLNSYNSDLKFSSWIYRITRNQVISYYRKQKVRPEKATFDWEINDDILNNMKVEFNIEKDLDQEYLRKKINKILDKLDLKYREVLIYRFFEEKSYEEISDILKKSKGTVASLLNRAKKRFLKINSKFKIED